MVVQRRVRGLAAVGAALGRKRLAAGSATDDATRAVAGYVVVVVGEYILKDYEVLANQTAYAWGAVVVAGEASWDSPTECPE